MISANSCLNLEFKIIRIKHQIAICKKYESILNLDKNNNKEKMIEIKNKITELENKKIELINNN